MQTRKLQVPAPDQRNQAATRVRRKTDADQQPGHVATTHAPDGRSTRQHRPTGYGSDPATGTGRIRGTFVSGAETVLLLKSSICVQLATTSVLRCADICLHISIRFS